MNLASYFILPLQGYSVSYFGSNLVNTYISKAGDKVFIATNGEEILLYEDENYIDDFIIDDLHITSLKANYRFRKDIHLFSQSKYSKMSDEAKELIIRASGLSWNVKTKNGFITDEKLLALCNHKTAIKKVRKKQLEFYDDYEDMMRNIPLDEDEELLPKLEDKDFITCLICQKR